jgi:sugar/nucleoside kinase (ribokinase family)
MTADNSPLYLLVGTVTKDLHADLTFNIGGTVTYASVIARNLGWRPAVVTSAGPDFTPPAYLADIDWHIQPAADTTTFRNVYDAAGHRHQTIGPVANTINCNHHVADLCREAAVVHLCPLAQDLEPSVVAETKNSILVATPQGWMRRWDEAGRVSRGDWEGAEVVLPCLQSAVISIEDVDGDWLIAEKWAAQTPTLIVTLGDAGCVIFHNGERLSVPPRPSHPIDPTGAGDVFAAAFFVRFQETGQLWASARFANVAASMAIERIGPEGAPLRHEIEDYLAEHPQD